MNVLLSTAVQASDDDVAATSFHFRRAGLTRTKYVINERRHQGCDEGTVIGREEIEAIEIGRDKCMPSP